MRQIVQVGRLQKHPLLNTAFLEGFPSKNTSPRITK
jgi:hypothetical protein